MRFALGMNLKRYVCCCVSVWKLRVCLRLRFRKEWEGEIETTGLEERHYAVRCTLFRSLRLIKEEMSEASIDVEHSESEQEAIGGGRIGG